MKIGKNVFIFSVQFSCFKSVQSLSCVWFFVTPWIAAWSITNSRSLLKLMSIESVMPSIHLILCRPLSSCPQSFLASGSFPVSQLFASGGWRLAASASVLPLAGEASQTGSGIPVCRPRACLWSSSGEFWNSGAGLTHVQGGQWQEFPFWPSSWVDPSLVAWAAVQLLWGTSQDCCCWISSVVSDSVRPTP